MHRLTDWVKTAEAATLDRIPGDLEQAKAAFGSLPRGEQLRLVEELVATRRGEITRAHTDIISVSAGYRAKNDGKETRRVEPEVCVILVVKKKSRSKPARSRAPENFFAYWNINGQRTLCAVQTDVEDGDRLRRIRPNAQIEAAAPAETTETIKGVVACAITRGNDETVYAIGCRHVFGMGLILDPAQNHDVELHLIDGVTELGKSTPIAGRLGNGPHLSFDSQLAEVFVIGTLRTALGGVMATERALSWDDLQPGADYWIVTPRGPVRAHYVAQHVEPVEYTPTLNDVRHFELARFLLFKDQGGPELPGPGDSGSPVLTEQTGGMLIGMYIAGDRVSIGLAIPAWQLLHPGSYDNGPTDETWKLWKG